MKTENKPIEVSKVIKDFSSIEDRLHRAKLPFETGMLQNEVLEVVSYELIRAHEELESLIRYLHPEKFAVRTVSQLVTPKLTVNALNVCPYCGEPECASDHK